ncbi:hypothetical protein [Laedolimicola sp.]|uniref:mannitol dehydrogenase family protein n=1 Tax=Laedolimicola sp. TaxID=2981663 RepID=UPI003F7E0630
MKALVFGAGKIARGFVGQLLELSGWETTFVDINRDLVQALNEKGTYTVHILGDPSLNTDVTHYRAIALDDEAAIRQTLGEADLAFTSVGGKNLESVGAVIAAAWKGVTRKKPLNFITCENWKDAGKVLENGIVKNLDGADKAYFEERAAVSEGVIMRTGAEPSAEQKAQEPLGVWVQNFWELPVNRDTFRGELPEVKGVYLMEHFGHFLEQKMYTNNTSNAVIAYNGYLYGYEILPEAAVSPQIAPLLDEVYPEINAALVAELGVDPEKQAALAKKARAKYSDPELVDRIIRNAKDPIRKLGPQDRLIAPAHMALKHGIDPKVIIRTIAAALYYDELTDESAVELKRLRETEGIPYILKNICKLDEKEVLYTRILEAVEELKQEGICQ